MNITPVTYKLIYDNKNITRDIADHLLSLTYTDKVEGECDELNISVKDSDLLWQNDWYPTKGAKLQASIIQDGLELNCGTFAIDEIELSSDRSGGDKITIKALAAFITQKIRTKRTIAHENKSLREICNAVASQNGLTVQGTIDNIIIKRINQYEQTDLNFLYHLAKSFGYTFSVRGSVITFTSIYDLEKKEHVLSIDKTDLTGWSVKDSTVGVFNKANIKYHNHKTNTTLDESVDSEGDTDTEDGFNSADILELRKRAENQQQAQAMAKAALHDKNSREKTGSVSMPGNVLIVSGNNFELTGMGTLSGIQHILSATHTIDRSGGYVCQADIKAVAKIEKSKWKPKVKKVTQQESGPAPLSVYHSSLFNTLEGPFSPIKTVNN